MSSSWLWCQQQKQQPFAAPFSHNYGGRGGKQAPAIDNWSHVHVSNYVPIGGGRDGGKMRRAATTTAPLQTPETYVDWLKLLYETTSNVYEELMRVTEQTRSAQGGRWKNPVLYKTEFCDNVRVHGFCRYGPRCWFAHSKTELRNVPRLDQVPQLLDALRMKIISADTDDLCCHISNSSSVSNSASSLRDVSPHPPIMKTAADVAAEQWTTMIREGIHSTVPMIGPFPHCRIAAAAALPF